MNGGEREGGGGGESERNCIVMDGYMLMNKKQLKKTIEYCGFFVLFTFLFTILAVFWGNKEKYVL